MGPLGDTLPRRRVPSKGLVNSEGRRRESPRRGQSPVPCARRLRRDGRPAGLGRAFFLPDFNPRDRAVEGEPAPGPVARALRPSLASGRPADWSRPGFFFRQTFPARLLGLRRRPGLGRGRAASPGCLLCCPLEGPGRPGAWRWRPPTRPGDRRLLRPVNRKLKGARPDGAREHRPTGTHNPSWLLRRQAGGLMSPARPRAGDPGRPGLWIDRLTLLPDASAVAKNKRVIQLLAVDHSARASMKNAASCEK